MATPVLRFKQNDSNNYPDWESIKIGDFVTFSKGKSLSKSDLTEDTSEQPCILYGELYTKYNEVTKQIYSHTFRDANELRLSEANDVVIPSSGETYEDISRALFVAKESVALGGDLIILRQNKINGATLSYILNHQQKMNIAKIATGDKVIHLSAEELKKLVISYPASPEEQQKIADFFLDIDTQIENYQQALDNLESQKNTLIRQVFAQELRFTRDDGSDYPDWEEDIIDNVSERIIVGLATTVTPYYRDSGIVMFRNLNITPNKLDDTDILYLDKDYALRNKSKYIHTGDVLTVHTGNVGITCVVPDKYNDVLSFTTLITTVKEDRIINTYLSQYLNSPEGLLRQRKVGTDGTRSNLNVAEFKAVKIPVPCLEEQRKITELFSDLDERIELERQRLQTMQDLKRGMLQQMFC